MCKQRLLQIGSKEMFADLKGLGMTPRKTNDLRFPNVPDKYLGDFVRGYFDGDGNVYCKKHFAKNRGKYRLVFKSRFTSSDKEFLSDLHSWLLNQKGINNGFIQKSGNSYVLVFSHNDSLALFDLMYNNSDCSLLLKRKFVAFQEAITRLYGNHAGVA